MSTKWISVKTPPEIGEYVLVNVGTNTVLKGRLMNNGWTAFFADGERLAGEVRPVTHWQPLPPPPGEEDNLSKQPFSSYANKKILKELNWLWQIFDEAKEHGAANVILGRIKEYEKKVSEKEEPISEDELKHKFVEVVNQEFGNLVMTPLANKCIKIAKQYANSKLQAIDEILLNKAKDLRISVDFSDKEYEGDKEAPMDRIGFLEYVINLPF